MALVHEIKAKSTGFPGAPGWTTLYFSNDGAADTTAQFHAVFLFLTAIRAEFPTTWTVQIEAAGRLLDEVTGELIGFTTVPAGDAASMVGTQGASYGSGVSGAVIGWSTNTVNRGRKIRGRTFLVPIAAPAWQADGTLLQAAIDIFKAAADALLFSTAKLVVWSRPVANAGGKMGPVTASRINDRAAFLSSRR